jgi:4-alpha-glucanotransferase
MHFERSSGILLHPTSLPGPYGSGDLGASAYHFVDWLAVAGQKLWQMLPLGGIGPGNSPYMSSSAFAGNALLIDLDELRAQGWLETNELTPPSGFNAHRVDYGLTHTFRMEKLRLAARRFFHGGHGRTAFEAFCAEEAGWLDDYALFMALADHHGWADWCDWPAPLARRDKRALTKAAAELHESVGFWKFCQWSFFRQWRKLKHYANEHGVQIVGDIPIFIAYQSAEVWANQSLFKLGRDKRPTVVAGVPPDFFSETGQRWGNPLYHWPAHEKEGYAWWIARLRQTIALVDIVRIDHFRGFAGYWEIPADEPTAINGCWRPGPGAKLFEAIRAALGKLPIIAEDLGVITPDVVALRDQFELPGMRILQFAFGDDANNAFLPHNYVANTVVYGGTHDNDTAVGWFQSASERERAFACTYLGSNGNEIHWNLIHAASQSVANLAIHPMQDVLGLGTDCRMNLPGKGEGYWEWRFSWDQVQPWHAERLRALSAVHGRCAMDRLPF